MKKLGYAMILVAVIGITSMILAWIAANSVATGLASLENTGRFIIFGGLFMLSLLVEVVLAVIYLLKNRG